MSEGTGESVGVRMFRMEHAKAYENIISDVNLSEQQKIEFVEHLSNYISGDFVKYCNEGFFYKKSLLGPEVIFEVTMLGRVQTELSVYARIAELSGLTLVSATVWLNDILMLDEEEQLEELSIMLGEKTISFAPMWSFVPNFDYPNRDLPCILALNHDPPFFHFRHNLTPAIKVHQSTAFDAGFYDAWKHGGLTQPLEHCREKEGLREVVHSPNYFSNIATAIERL